MKTTGPMNIWHLVPWVRKHITDAEKQALDKGGRERRRARRHLTRLAARMLRKLKRDTPDPAHEEVSILPEDLKFPPIGLGVVLFPMEPLGPTLDGSPLRPAWRRFGNGELGQLQQCFEDVGKWHSGYAARQGTAGAMKPEWYAHTDSVDNRFYQGTLTLPQWDSEALSESLKEGEVSAADFNGLLDRLLLRLTDGKFESLVSCGQRGRMVMTGLFVHPQDGVIHLHPVFLRSARLAFLKNDGRILPACLAPKGGRRAKGEGWVGGEPLGFKPSKGQWVTNSIGVALCAADALKKEKIPPPRQYGYDWRWLHLLITERMKGTFAKKKGDGRTRSLGLGTPYDLWGSRVLRQEVRSFAQRNVAFRIRREGKIAEARAVQAALNESMVYAVAAPELAGKDAIIAELKAQLKQERAEKAKGNLATPQFSAVEMINALQAANDALGDGKDLSGLTDRQREIVWEPVAGKVALTPRARQIAEFAVSSAQMRLSSSGLTAKAIVKLKEDISEYSEVLEASEASLRIGVPTVGGPKRSIK